MFKVQVHEHGRWKTTGYFADMMTAADVADRLDSATRVVELAGNEVVDLFLQDAHRERAKAWKPRALYDEPA